MRLIADKSSHIHTFQRWKAANEQAKLKVNQDEKPRPAKVMATYAVPVDHFTIVCLVAWPLNKSEDEADLALIET